MKKIYIVRIVLLILIGFWMGTIFGFSAENGESSQSLSDKITVKVVKYIEPEYYSEDEAAKVLAEHDILVKVDMGTGDASAKAWGCDLTYDYVKINGDYRT